MTNLTTDPSYTVSSVDHHSHPEDGTTVWFTIGGETVGINLDRITGSEKFLDCDGFPCTLDSLPALQVAHMTARARVIGIAAGPRVDPSTPTLFAIAEGILEASEYIEENLSSALAVDAYAEGAGRNITYEQAELIHKVLTNWITRGAQTDGSVYFWEVRRPLEAADE